MPKYKHSDWMSKGWLNGRTNKPQLMMPYRPGSRTLRVGKERPYPSSHNSSHIRNSMLSSRLGTPKQKGHHTPQLANLSSMSACIPNMRIQNGKRGWLFHNRRLTNTHRG